MLSRVAFLTGYFFTLTWPILRTAKLYFYLSTLIFYFLQHTSSVIFLLNIKKKIEDAAWEAKPSQNATWHAIGCRLKSSQSSSAIHFSWRWLAESPRADIRRTNEYWKSVNVSLCCGTANGTNHRTADGQYCPY